MLEIGDRQTRDGLSVAYGDNFNCFALVKDGLVRAIAVTTLLNPEAPEVVLVGPGDIRAGWTNAIEDYQGPIDVWVRDDLRKPDQREYEFQGIFTVQNVSREQKDLSSNFRAPTNKLIPVEAVIRLKRAQAA